MPKYHWALSTCLEVLPPSSNHVSLRGLGRGSRGSTQRGRCKVLGLIPQVGCVGSSPAGKGPGTTMNTTQTTAHVPRANGLSRAWAHGGAAPENRVHCPVEKCPMADGHSPSLPTPLVQNPIEGPSSSPVCCFATKGFVVIRAQKGTGTMVGR